MVQLGHLANRYPSQLSGGQKQRVALARARRWNRKFCCWTNRSARWMRRCAKLRRWLRQLHEELKFTSVFVTRSGRGDGSGRPHRGDERGNIEQVGSPEEIMREPASRFVLEFMGK